MFRRSPRKPLEETGKLAASNQSRKPLQPVSKFRPRKRRSSPWAKSLGRTHSQTEASARGANFSILHQIRDLNSFSRSAIQSQESNQAQLSYRHPQAHQGPKLNLNAPRTLSRPSFLRRR